MSRWPTSLAAKVTIPILLVIAPIAAVNSWLLVRSSEQQQRATLQQQAEATLVAVELAADVSDLVGLRRATMALGADPSVRRLVVVAGDPAIVMASSENSWVGLTAADLPEDVREALALGGRSQSSAFVTRTDHHAMTVSGSLQTREVGRGETISRTR